MKTIALINQKGGVGKTTLAVTLAAGLAVAGKRVVLVDTDPQGNVAKWFGMPEEAGIYDLLIKEQPVGRLLRLVPAEKWSPSAAPGGALAILPGNGRTTTAGVALAVDRAPSDVLRKRLEPLARSGIDFCILDTSPTVTELMLNVFVASDFCIIPTEPAMLSVNGVTKTADRIALVRDNVPLEVIGVVPNKVKARTLEHQQNLATLRELYGDLVWPVVNHRVRWEECPAYAKSIFAYEPARSAAVREAAMFVGTFWRAMNARGVA